MKRLISDFMARVFMALAFFSLGFAAGFVYFFETMKSSIVKVVISSGALNNSIIINELVTRGMYKMGLS